MSRFAGKRPERPSLTPRPPGDLWVFGYGSLMWRPHFPHTDVQPALVHGYHRALCIYSVAYRGTYECPGLVFGLDRGGACKGLAFKVAENDVDNVMGYLWEREMITGVYRPRILHAEMPDGSKTIKRTIWGFIADRDHDQYTGRLADNDAVKLILQGQGMAGPCLDYLKNTLDHLTDQGIHDRSLARIIKKAETGKI